MVALVTHKERKTGYRTSGILLTFWILMTIYGTFKLRTYILTGLDEVKVHPSRTIPNFFFFFFLE